MNRQALSLVLTISVCACGNAPIGGAALDVVPSDAGTDVADVDTSDASSDPTTECQDDIYGETSTERAIAVSDGAALEGLTACVGTPDHFLFTPAVGATTATVAVRSPGAIEFSVDGETSTGEEFVVVRDVGASAPIEVIVTSAESVLYDIEFSSEVDENRDCRLTPEEPNDSPESPFLVEDAVFELATRVCDADDDWFAFDVPTGGVLTVALEFTHDHGDIDAAIYRSEDLDDPVAESNSGDDGELLRVGPVAEAGRYLLHVYGWEGATNAYSLESNVTVEGDGFTAEVSGSLAYEDRVFAPTGFTGELVDTPVADVVMQVVRVSDGSVVGDGVSASAGEYALQFFAQSEEEYRVRALSVGTLDGFRVEVRDRTGDSALYAVESEAFAAAPEVAGVNLTAAADDGIGGALNIVDQTNLGFAFVARYSDERSPTLTYFWQSGQSYSCGSCYSGNAIRLGGQLEDPDEYDDDIILHEFAHYMVEHFSADNSPGGAHRDRLVNPYLAYGEGLAYFLSSAIREDPTMTDNFLGDARFIDYEAVTLGGEDLDDFYDTANGRVDGNQREELPAAIIWDVWDGPNDDEPWDTIALGDRTIELLFDYFHEGMPVDVGVRGIEISDFINAVACELDGPVELQPVVDDREFPFEVAEESDCSMKAEPSAWTLREEHGALVAVGAIANTAVDAIVRRDGQERRLVIECAAPGCVILDEVGPADTVVAVAYSSGERSASSWLGAEALEQLLGGRLVQGPNGAVRVYEAARR